MIHNGCLATVLLPLLAGGCGLMAVPMVPRLDEAQQARMDGLWEAMLKPADRLDRQSLLDALVVTTAHQQGVDKVLYRSEKRWSGGTVVMEVRFNRAVPAEDLYEVQVLDAAGKVLRRERYDRKTVEGTCRELSETFPRDKKAPETPEQKRRRIRLEAVEALMPPAPGPAPAPAPAP